MQARLSFLALLFSALLVLASPAFSAGGSAPSGEGVSPRCEAAIDKAAGSYGQCLLKASAKFAKKGNEDRLFAQQMRCGDKFDAQVARAQDRYGEEKCTPYTRQIADRTATCAEEVSMEAGGKAAASRLYVQDAAGGTLTETTLVLSGVDESTPWFTDRPYREAGQITTAEFVALFSEEGANSFAADPPNADFTCESGGEVVNQVVTLTDPVLDETAGTLTYNVALVPNGAGGDSTEITCDGDAHLFVDDVTINNSKLVSFCQWDAVCKAAGGVWDAATNRCTPGVTQVGCEAGGGTWDAETSKCAPAYNCFNAGYCAQAAKIYPPATWGYTNVYEKDKVGTGPAVACRASSAAFPLGGRWADGQGVFRIAFSSTVPDVVDEVYDDGSLTLSWFAQICGTTQSEMDSLLERCADPSGPSCPWPGQ